MFNEKDGCFSPASLQDFRKKIAEIRTKLKTLWIQQVDARQMIAELGDVPVFDHFWGCYPDIGDHEVGLLSEYPKLKKLSVIGKNSIGNEGMSRLTHLVPQMTTLEVDFYVVTDGERLVESIRDASAKLEKLHFCNVKLGTDAFHDLVSGLRLGFLSLTNCKLVDATLEAISRMKRQISHLYLMRNKKVTSSGVTHLQGQRSLISLSLADTAVDDEAIETLNSLSTLDDLCLEGTNVTASGLLALRLPKLTRLRIPTAALGGIQSTAAKATMKGNLPLLSEITHMRGSAEGKFEGKKLLRKPLPLFT